VLLWKLEGACNMYIETSIIFAIIVITILFILPVLESKGLFLNRNIINYYSELKYVLNNQLKLNNTELLKLAVAHLSSEYKYYKKASCPMEYTLDLVANSQKKEVVTAWAYLFILQHYKQSPALNEDLQKTILEICIKNLQSISYPISFKSYFNFN
jgi:hypothetical protein